jgi:hypothetical protein
MKTNKTTPAQNECWVLRKAIKGVANSQNMDRDFLNIAQAGLVEKGIVSKYRQDLLDDSDSAWWLRGKLGKILLKAQKAKRKTYTWVDSVTQAEESISEPEVDIGNIITATQIDRDYRTEKQEVQSNLKRLRDSVVTQATPWTKDASTEMIDKMNELEKVSFSTRSTSDPF